MSRTRKILFLFLAMVMLVSGLGLGVETAQAATCTRYHTVQRGESLFGIGLQYGVSWTVLAQWNNITQPGRIFAGQVLCVSQTGAPAPAPQPGVVPTFTITAVTRDQTVTISARNFPANDTFDVLMGHFRTQGVNGIKVGTQASGNGTFTATYNIPAGLASSYRIAIRLQSPTSGYFSFNWFYNNTAGSGQGGVNPPTTTPPATGVIPTFSIAAVVRNSTVTITTRNFPANLSFDVLMGHMGTRAVNGIKVGTLNSGAGGTLSATFNIPAELRGLPQIAIRTQNAATGYFSYNWFWNNNAP